MFSLPSLQVKLRHHATLRPLIILLCPLPYADTPPPPRRQVGYPGVHGCGFGGAPSRPAVRLGQPRGGLATVSGAGPVRVYIGS